MARFLALPSFPATLRTGTEVCYPSNQYRPFKRKGSHLGRDRTIANASCVTIVFVVSSMEN